MLASGGGSGIGMGVTGLSTTGLGRILVEPVNKGIRVGV